MYNSLIISSLNLSIKFTLTSSSKPSLQLGSSYEDLKNINTKEKTNYGFNHRLPTLLVRDSFTRFDTVVKWCCQQNN